MKQFNRTLSFSRRNLLMAFLSLSAFFAVKRGKNTQPDDDETVVAGGWVLKKSDVS